MSGRESVDRQNKADGIKVGQKATPSFGLMKQGDWLWKVSFILDVKTGGGGY